MKITVTTTVKAPVQRVWAAWTTPESITKWNFASDDWCCPHASIDLAVGAKFSYRMEAKDGSFGFDFEGKFTRVETNKSIEYIMDDGRKVWVSFEETADGVTVSETFDAENQHSAEMQRQGWQSILENFKKHTESLDC